MTALKVLIAATNWWPSSSYLAIAFKHAGANVYTLTPHGNSIQKLNFLKGSARYSARQPSKSLALAVKHFEPDIIVPMDDRTVSHLHALHAGAAFWGEETAQVLRAIIERSLGAPTSYDICGTRHDFLKEMRAQGVPVPDGIALSSIHNTRVWCAAHEPPWVVKAEDSWGGSGVIFAETLNALEAARQTLASPLPYYKAIRLRFVDRDLFAWMRFRHGKSRNVMAQAYVEGRQFTCMAACWQGQLLGTVNAECLVTQGRTGASTMLEIVNVEKIHEIAKVTAAHLKLSGFFGLDFIREDTTGIYYLIEMNPRATQIGHIRTGGADLATRLYQAAGSGLPSSNDLPDHGSVIALFPQSLRFLSKDTALAELPLDVPWSEPALAAELLREPWTKRSILARLEALFRRNDAFGTAIEPRRVREILAEISRRHTLHAQNTPRAAEKPENGHCTIQHPPTIA